MESNCNVTDSKLVNVLKPGQVYHLFYKDASKRFRKVVYFIDHIDCAYAFTPREYLNAQLRRSGNASKAGFPEIVDGKIEYTLLTGYGCQRITFTNSLCDRASKRAAKVITHMLSCMCDDTTCADDSVVYTYGGQVLNGTTYIRYKGKEQAKFVQYPEDRDFDMFDPEVMTEDDLPTSAVVKYIKKAKRTLLQRIVRFIFT